jgi:hypothetical protein
VGQGLLIIEASLSQTHHTPQYSSGQLIGPTQKPLTTLTRNRHPCPRRDSNPQSKQVNGRRPTPQDGAATESCCITTHYTVLQQHPYCTQPSTPRLRHLQENREHRKNPRTSKCKYCLCLHTRSDTLLVLITFHFTTFNFHLVTTTQSTPVTPSTFKWKTE